jgi:hypothetical protein
MPYLIVNSVIVYPPHYKGKRVEWERSLLLVELEHICICLLISKTTNRKRKGRGEGVRADPLSLNIHFMEHGQPHA